MSEKHSAKHSPDSLYEHAVGLTFPGTLMERMGMEVLEHRVERTVVRMPVAGNTQRVGILHGGATAALAETAGSLAASTTVTDDHTIVVGVELSISHLRTAREGMVTATALPEHLGRTSTVHLVRIEDEKGRLISTARISNRLIPRRAE